MATFGRVAWAARMDGNPNMGEANTDSADGASYVKPQLQKLNVSNAAGGKDFVTPNETMIGSLAGGTS